MIEDWDTIDEWLETLEQEYSDKLNSWEIEFIDSIRTRALNRWELSEAQVNKLRQIHSKQTKG